MVTSILRENLSEWFDLECDSPYMTLVCNIKEDKKVASTLNIDVGFMDLKERKLMNFPEQWIYMVEQ